MKIFLEVNRESLRRLQTQSQQVLSNGLTVCHQLPGIQSQFWLNQLVAQQPCSAKVLRGDRSLPKASSEMVVGEAGKQEGSSRGTMAGFHLLKHMVLGGWILVF